MLKLQLSRDTNGHPRAKVQAPYQLLGQYLHSDVQSIPSRCQVLTGLVEDVQSGRKSEWEDVGNAFELHISRERVRIQSLFLEPAEFIEMPLEDFSKALVEWLAFIRK